MAYSGGPVRNTSIVGGGMRSGFLGNPTRTSMNKLSRRGGGGGYARPIRKSSR